MDVVNDETLGVLSVTDNGIGKRTKICEYKKQSRGGKGRISYRLSPKTGSVVGMCIVHPDDELFLFTAKGYVLCVDADELKNCGRFARGVIAMRLHEGDKVTAVSKANRGIKH
jgi:DNA gyrase subunit A